MTFIICILAFARTKNPLHFQLIPFHFNLFRSSSFVSILIFISLPFDFILLELFFLSNYSNFTFNIALKVQLRLGRKCVLSLDSHNWCHSVLLHCQINSMTLFFSLVLKSISSSTLNQHTVKLSLEHDSLAFYSSPLVWFFVLVFGFVCVPFREQGERWMTVFNLM